MTRQGDFWSRRREAVRQEAEREAQAAQAAEAEAERAALEAREDEEILAELDLPDPDTLAPGDDIRGFMSSAVPDRLRRRALRRLWRLNPVLANVDGLVEYGEDYTDAATVIENLQTAYQVGRGMMAHVEEMARQAAEAEREADAPERPVAEAADPQDAPGEDLETAAETPEPDPEPDHETAPPEDAPARAPRRMTFAFQE